MIAINSYHALLQVATSDLAQVLIVCAATKSKGWGCKLRLLHASNLKDPTFSQKVCINAEQTFFMDK